MHIYNGSWFGHVTVSKVAGQREASVDLKVLEGMLQKKERERQQAGGDLYSLN